MRIVDVVPFEDADSPYEAMVKVEEAQRWFCDYEGPGGMLFRPSSLEECPDCGARRP